MTAQPELWWRRLTLSILAMGLLLQARWCAARTPRRVQAGLRYKLCALAAAQAPRTQPQLHPLVDFILPVWPTANCLSPLRTDSSTAVPSAAYNAYYAQINNKIKQFSLTGLVIQLQCARCSAASNEQPRCSQWATGRRQSSLRVGGNALRRCKASLILHGTIECYIIFDKTSYRTGLNAIKNVAPYNGITLNFCAVELDGGPIRTSTICFDNSGLDPQHPYVIVKACAHPQDQMRSSAAAHQSQPKLKGS